MTTHSGARVSRRWAGAIDYDGRRFSPVDDEAGELPVAQYHQDEDLVWAEFSGGDVRRGSIVGTSDQDGELRFAYCMVLGDGQVITGRCRSVPEVLSDRRVRLVENWERYGPDPSTGVSILEELHAGACQPSRALN